ncbi:MAG: tRNA-dihydrouridine synthase family protein [Muribaculaceae bacterium]|nr:tRNA-dihydrouridine synthase family protein [Muribaculaceae bacterium]
MKYYFAPVQGHTDAAYRHFHAAHYGHTAESDRPIVYTTPFIRLEKGELRKKDFKDATSELNAANEVVPQVIFKNGEELHGLVELLKSEGFGRIDINMGCPFPLQTSRGRGAATIANEECRRAVKEVVESNPEIDFSVKMRLGFAEEEYKPLIETLNNLKLNHISVHPRTAKDQYSGNLHPEAFSEIYRMSSNPIVYNGEIKTPSEAKEIIEKYPDLAGIMIGRGALARPSIFAEILSGEEWSEERRRKEMMAFHRRLFSYYRDNLIGGDHQVLSKIQPFWEYSEEEIGRKAWKAIKKASNMSKYQTALALI